MHHAVHRQLLRLPSQPGDLSHADGLAYYRTYHRPLTTPETGEYTLLIASSPNSNWCPWPKSPGSPAHVRYDGTLGPDDPISWPQQYAADFPHLPCIPISDPSSDSLVHTFRRGLRKDQVSLTDEWEDNLRVAVISRELVLKLDSGLDLLLKDVERFPPGSHPRLEYLIEQLRIAVSSLSTLKQTLLQLRLMFGIASRLYLEARGYVDYHLKYRPLLESDGEPTVNDHLVGVWVSDEATCKKYHRMGVPVWSLRSCLVGTEKFVKYCEPRIYRSRPMWPQDRFRDDGIVREEVAIVNEQTDTRSLLRAVDSWARSKLESDFR